MEVLITGGEQGLGKAILDKMEPVSYRNIPGEDIMDAAYGMSLKQLAEESIDYNDLPNILINNCGINHLSDIGKTPENDRLIMDVNVMFPYWLVDAMAFRESPCRVLNISSQTYRIPQRKTALYCASKAALSQMTKVMARELAPRGWVINAFAPGKILGTRMTELTDAQVNKLRGWTQKEADVYAKSLVPMGRFMTLDEASDIALHILNSPDYINGTTIEAFGGL